MTSSAATTGEPRSMQAVLPSKPRRSGPQRRRPGSGAREGGRRGEKRSGQRRPDRRSPKSHNKMFVHLGIGQGAKAGKGNQAPAQRCGEFERQGGGFEWRLKVKPQGSTRPGLQPGSQVPRFDARTGPGQYVNPFTGQRGGRGVGTHLPLDHPWF